MMAFLMRSLMNPSELAYAARRFLSVQDAVRHLKISSCSTKALGTFVLFCLEERKHQFLVGEDFQCFQVPPATRARPRRSHCG